MTPDEFARLDRKGLIQAFVNGQVTSQVLDDRQLATRIKDLGAHHIDIIVSACMTQRRRLRNNVVRAMLSDTRDDVRFSGIKAFAWADTTQDPTLRPLLLSALGTAIRRCQPVEAKFLAQCVVVGLYVVSTTRLQGNGEDDPHLGLIREAINQGNDDGAMKTLSDFLSWWEEQQAG